MSHTAIVIVGICTKVERIILEDLNNNLEEILKNKKITENLSMKINELKFQILY
ncbi:hypothetical protein [Spiroplasma taiwanense]|uniref:Uncharacterized protein n=1 Tax=Spiroplasma taiwanense CT-1 TaxID=1276220 RepID=S5MAP3_9MOLU|nr:hypothetical protein [Spiroplasma taiwanense]AGR40828.1 hypothetical protein STAIW_v1c01420 [Spiroplasma taiwanense CT-1]